MMTRVQRIGGAIIGAGIATSAIAGLIFGIPSWIVCFGMAIPIVVIGGLIGHFVEKRVDC